MTEALQLDMVSRIHHHKKGGHQQTTADRIISTEMFGSLISDVTHTVKGRLNLFVENSKTDAAEYDGQVGLQGNLHSRQSDGTVLRCLIIPQMPLL